MCSHALSVPRILRARISQVACALRPPVPYVPLTLCVLVSSMPRVLSVLCPVCTHIL